MRDLLNTHPLVLMEGAIVERLRRGGGSVGLHETLVNAPLVYDPAGREALAALYQGYVDIARAAGLPILLCTPTWRANRERVATAEVPESINRDAAAFMDGLRRRPENRDAVIRIGGLMGCRHDCYRPAEGLDAAAAEAFHGWQAAELAAAGVDCLVAVTLPAVEEASGLARAMAATGLPYLISFVIDRHGRVLDGTPLADAVRAVDAAVERRPDGYLVNCAHPSFLCPEQQPAALFERLVGYQANASALDHCDLDQAAQLHADDLAAWTAAMVALHRRHGLGLLGGCCGTGDAHLRGIAAGVGAPA